MNASINETPSSWQLQDAKSRFSKVVKLAEEGMPQLVTRNGVPTVYIVAASSYNRLIRKSASRKDVLRNSPYLEIELDLNRQRDEGREVLL